MDIWFDGTSYWVIGAYIAYIKSDVFCPHQLIHVNWALFNGKKFMYAGEDLYLTCKYSTFLFFTLMTWIIMIGK